MHVTHYIQRQSISDLPLKQCQRSVSSCHLASSASCLSVFDSFPFPLVFSFMYSSLCFPVLVYVCVCVPSYFPVWFCEKRVFVTSCRCSSFIATPNPGRWDTQITSFGKAKSGMGKCFAPHHCMPLRTAGPFCSLGSRGIPASKPCYYVMLTTDALELLQSQQQQHYAYQTMYITSTGWLATRRMRSHADGVFTWSLDVDSPKD